MTRAIKIKAANLQIQGLQGVLPDGRVRVEGGELKGSATSVGFTSVPIEVNISSQETSL